MNLVLTYCWREWRSQRGMLLAYTALGLSALALGFTLLPAHWWQEDGQAALALSWFVALGVIGVVAFVAPGLVRSEFGGKGDQFVRRLPGALGPSFAGKLLFLGLAALLLPLLCLLVGQGYLLAAGRPWHDLFRWQWTGEVQVVWPWTVPGIVGAALLVPWVWAIGTWLPGGRMALGGTIVCTLVLALGVFAVLRQSPGLLGVASPMLVRPEAAVLGELAWRWWWVVPTSGLLVAVVGWVRGRRGGGALRSARFGLAATAALLAPPGLWLGAAAWEYHHPDLHRLGALHVQGLSPDGRSVLAVGAARPEYQAVPLRIDLATGAGVQLGGVGLHFTTDVAPEHQLMGLGRFNGVRRHWLGCEPDGRLHVLDLATGRMSALGGASQAGREPLPAALAAAVRAGWRAAAPFRAPDGRSAWTEGDDVCLGGLEGEVERVPLPVERPYSLHAAGHAIRVNGRKVQLFDLGTRRLLPWRGTEGFVVRGVLVGYDHQAKSRGWLRQALGGPAEVAAPLAKAVVLGLFDDDHLLGTRPRHLPGGGTRRELFLYRPADDTAVPLPVDAESLDVVRLLAPTALLPRDPAGRLWLQARTGAEETFVVFDPVAGTVRTLLPFVHRGWTSRQVLGWPDAEHVLLREGTRLVRARLADGAREVLFPR